MNTAKTIPGTRSLDELQKQYSGAGKPGAPGRGPGGPMGGPRRGGGPGVRAKGKPKNMRATVMRLLSYVAKYKFQLVLVFVFMITNTLTSLYAGYQLKPIFNMLIDTTVTAEQRVANLVQTLLILACVYAVGIVTNYVQARLMLKISQNTTEALRRDLFNSVQELPVRFFDSTPTGETMSRFTNDIDSIDMMINHALTGMVSGVINLVGTFCMMLYTNIWLTIITIVFIPIFAKGGGAIAKLSTKYYSGQQAALGAVNGYIEESVTGQKVVKVFNHEDICVEEFTTLNNDMRDKQFKAQFWGGVMGPIMGADMRKRGVIGMLDGCKVVRVPAKRLPEGFGFMIAHPSATVAPNKLNEFNVHLTPPGVSGNLIEGRVVYDAFVLDNKKKGIYYQAITTAAEDPEDTPEDTPESGAESAE